MTSQKQTNDDLPKGFAGLSSLVSDVDDVINSTEIKKPEVLNEEIINDSPKGFSGLVTMISDVESTNESQKSESLKKKAALDMNQSKSYIPSQRTSKNSSKTKNWIVVLGIILGLIWFMSESEKKPIVQHSISIRPSEEKPPVGTNLTFNLAQIRYCLSEDIRMDGAKTIMNSYNTSDIDKFNGMITDYNSRCSQFRYRQGLLESAKREIEPYRSVLELEGHDRFKDNTSSKKKLIENEPITDSSQKTKAISIDSTYLLSDAKMLVVRMIDNALIDGGLKNESEIQKIQKRITALPKPKKTNIKEARDANNNGLALVKKGNYEDAVKFFESGEKLNSADIEIVGNLGFAYVKLNQLDSAQQAMITSLAMAPNRATAWANLGDVYALKNDKSRAVACLANAYRFSRNREKTHQFFKLLNEKEDVEQLKQARNEAINWAEETYFADSKVPVPSQKTNKSSEQSSVDIANFNTCIRGSTPWSCKHDLLTRDQAIQVEIAEKHDNFNTCIRGSTPWSCKHDLLTRDQATQVEIAEKHDNFNTCIRGSTPWSCKHDLLTRDQAIQVEIAEKHDNFNTCIRGSTPWICKHDLLTRDQAIQVEIAEKHDNFNTCIRGSTPWICKHDLLTRDQAIQVEIAEKHDNFNTCIRGSTPWSCKHDLLTRDQTIQVDEAERRAK